VQAQPVAQDLQERGAVVGDLDLPAVYLELDRVS